jgi:hypothetical protein
LALVVQILAPIAACWAAGIVASDPLRDFGAAAICHGGGQADHQPGPTGDHIHDGACALCCAAAHAGTSPDTPSATTVAEPSRHSLRVVWQDIASELRDSRTSGHAQARAPPTIS